MESDDEDFGTLNLSTRDRPVTSKKTVQQTDGGLLNEMHNSPKSASESDGQKKKSFLSRVATSDVSRFSARDHRMSDQVDTSSIRPMTAMSQAGDFSTAIPSLEDLEEADHVPQAVEAPFMAMNNLYSYQELEKDLMKNPAFSSFDDLDFSPLFSRLLPESEVVMEVDETWTWDKLVASVSSSLPAKKPH